ncbi:hypothetical protein [Kingella potus]|uniref:hypothetical protein n=1 Tax=Kingella potus TaxID=265175 RepID=UPI0011C04EC6|nr:hypothetical protein [Kingella potus]
MKTLISTVSKIAVPNTLSVILFRFACLALSEPFYFGRNLLPWAAASNSGAMAISGARSMVFCRQLVLPCRFIAVKGSSIPASAQNM